MIQIQILKEIKDKQLVILCAECNKNKLTVSKYNYDEFNKDLSNNEQWGIRYHYESLMCDTCKSNIEDIEQMDKNEDIEMEDRAQALNLEYLRNTRLIEPKKNQYCKIKNVSSYEYETKYDYKRDKWNKQESKKSYVFLCGQKYPLEYWTLETVTNEHIHKRNCGICKVLTGSKKTKGFTQYQVNELFRLGITNKSSSSKNFESQGNTVFHYRTIEKIRTENNTLIDNSQCWSAGFAHCELNLGVCELPLTSLDRNDFDIYSINVLDTKDAILFKIRQEIKHYAKDDEYKTHEVIKRTNETKYMLFGRDDGQNFLVELYDKPKTVKDAYKSMIPLEGRTKRKILRQGDLFFIPIDEDFGDSGKQYFQDLPKTLNYEQQEHRDNYIIGKLGNWILSKNNYYGKFGIKDATSRLLAQYASIEYMDKFVKAKKELVRNQIFDTNHESQYAYIANGNMYVKGQIIHTNRQHRKLVLNKWYQVVKNRVKGSFTVERFGSMGRD